MLKKIGRVISHRAVNGTLVGDFIKFLCRIIHNCFAFVFGIVHGILNFILSIIDKICKFITKLGYLIDIPIKKFAIYILFKITSVEDKVMMLTFQGDYTCNPKWITEELIKEKFEYPIVWITKKEMPTSDYPLELQFVKYGHFEFYKELASSKIIIENTNVMERLNVCKKSGQYVLQTWHGSMGIKRLDGAVVMGRKWKRIAKNCKKNVDFLLSDSTFETDVFKESYWGDVPSLLYGHARNDIFFCKDEEKIADIRHKVYDYLGLDENKKIFLYAPTHKDNVDENYDALDYEGIKQALEEKFGGEWQIVVRLHNRLKKKSKAWLSNLPEYVSNATFYEDMQELLLCTDAGVTDYSSWIFDYVLLHRPGFILAEDLEEFVSQRDFYYPLTDTPFPISTDDTSLIESITNFDNVKYQADIDTFLEARGCMEDGHASERIAGKIRELMAE